MSDNWKHRSKGMTCATCMWFVEKKPKAEGINTNQIGRCRRHAPTMNGYPVVFQSDWCGDHKLDETKINKPEETLHKGEKALAVAAQSNVRM